MRLAYRGRSRSALSMAAFSAFGSSALLSALLIGLVKVFVLGQLPMGVEAPLEMAFLQYVFLGVFAALLGVVLVAVGASCSPHPRLGGPLSLPIATVAGLAYTPSLMMAWSFVAAVGWMWALVLVVVVYPLALGVYLERSRTAA
ncbi:MAG: hypothetical protein K8J08_12570 [Thermoanaerobaculia bacterium]|nr:hypothetical protein [Thermoanaerobaculia bacterium]